jgi:transcriptional regulator with XRE-family HTH domain
VDGPDDLTWHHPDAVAGISSVADLGTLLRQLRRRQARQRKESALTYRELATTTGWAHGAIGNYLSGRSLPPTDRFDVLIRLLGATPAEQGVLATARDRVEERRRAASMRPADGVVEGPRQLPADVAGFTGRIGHLAELDRLLAADRRQPAVVIAVVSGTAGVGKTSLAIHWAHRVADRFPDGQLYVNLRGFDPGGQPMTAAEAVRGFLDALGVPVRRIPADLDAQVGLYRSLLAGRQVLIVLDNAVTAEQVRPLLPGAAGCAVVVTSRDQLHGLVAASAAHPVPLDVLTVDEARQLFGARLGAARIAAEPVVVDSLIAACARLPLALAIVAARAAIHPGFGLVDLVGELREGSARLDTWQAGDPTTDLRAVFSWSYRRLSPAPARLFRLLGLHPGPSIAAPAAASLVATTVDEVRTLLADLASAHLLTEFAPGRYTFHDLLRLYAAELADTIDSDVDRRTAQQRIFDHYLHTAYAATMVLKPQQLPIPIATRQPGVTPEEPTGREQAMAWFGAEDGVLIAAVGHAAEVGLDSHAWQLATTLTTFLDLRGRWHDWASVQTIAVSAAQRLADPLAQARTLRSLAGAMSFRQGGLDDALAYLGQALVLYGDLGNQAGEAQTHRSLGLLLAGRDRHREAIGHLRQACALSVGLDDRSGQAYALNAIGWCHAELREHRQAIASCQQAITLFEEIGDRHGEGGTWDTMGRTHHGASEYHQAVDCYRRGLVLSRQVGARATEAHTLEHLGDSLGSLGQPLDARAAWQEALDLFNELGDLDANRVRDKLHHDDVSHDVQPGPG